MYCCSLFQLQFLIIPKEKPLVGAVFWSIFNRMQTTQDLLEEARLLIYRLERISADSIWARRSSGHRGALLKWVEAMENQATRPEDVSDSRDLRGLAELIQAGYVFLEKAARERLR